MMKPPDRAKEQADREAALKAQAAERCKSKKNAAALNDLNIQNIYFDYDKSNIRPDAREISKSKRRHIHKEQQRQPSLLKDTAMKEGPPNTIWLWEKDALRKPSNIWLIWASTYRVLKQSVMAKNVRWIPAALKKPGRRTDAHSFF
ncbi:MAG: hypothetical protein MZV70_47820 [Desulfobacterales bacterium]|nr:hypothetical protein [Desulfobacterales bacterium]